MSMWTQSTAEPAGWRFAALTRLTAWASLIICIFGAAGTTYGGGRYLKVDYPGSTVPGELPTPVTYTLWIPDGAPRLRGIIVHQHGAGTTASIEGSTAAYDLHWQALAKKWDCALFSSSYHVLNEKVDLSPGGSEVWFDPRHGSEKVFLNALDEFAGKSGHPEVATVPWALWGHSGGGIWADVMSTLHPERVAVIWMRSGTAIMFRSKPEFPQPEVPAAVYEIPSMSNPGVKEKPNITWTGPLATFQEYRSAGAPICFAPDPRTGHECGDCRYLAIPFFDACLAMRLPDKGSGNQALKPVDMSKAWLAPLLGDLAVPAASYQGDPGKAVWLPNEAVAKAWMEYVKTGAVSDTTPPPAPYDVKVTPRADGAAEIAWSADADFESGIRSFLVLRDGQELAQVPRTPEGKFGRPLFQSMTYHDTPSQPMPEMRYVDTEAETGQEHTYAVITVNSVGLKSEPSAASPGETSSLVQRLGDMVLWYRQPAVEWLDAMPIGNGMMAAMVFGGTQQERIALNESSFWSGRPHDYDDPNAGKYFPLIRDLVFAGKFQEAGKMADEHFYGIPSAQQAYQPLGDLLLSFDGVDAVEDYRRELDMETGVTRVRYRAGDVVLTREVFISYPDRVMVVRITADKPGRVSVQAQFKSPYIDSVIAIGDKLVMDGCWKGPMKPENWLIAPVEGRGIRFQAVLKALPEGGRSEAAGDKVRIRQADAVTFVVTAGTSFINYKDISGNPAAICEKTLAGVADKDYAALRRRHEADFNALMGRVHLTVGDRSMNDKPIDERIQAIRAGTDDANLEAMLNKDGKLVNHWGRSSVPDVTRLETQLWFYYLAGSYINLGCEALHLGQVGLIGMADPDLKEWSGLLARIRVYAKINARRHLVLLDAHVPTWGMIVDGVSLLDFNSFPQRIKEVPDKPYEAVLEVGHLDAIFKKSKGCISPSGWKCRSLPYLVEFDNYGRSRSPNVADTRSIFVWGWDEISWLSLQDEEYRNKWLEYAYNWIKETDPNGHLQMPVSRMISCPNDTFGSYRANTRSPNCPIGYSQEETIRKIWSNARKE